MSAQGVSIRIFLVDGVPDGLRIVERSNWTGLGVVCARSQYAGVRNRPEFSRPGLYVLVGPGEGILPRVYIGEADNPRVRLDQHLAGKDFWTRLVLFTSKDGNLNKAHVRHLESRLIGIAESAKRAQVQNGNAPSAPALSEADLADAESFLQDMLLIYPILEITAFQPVPAAIDAAPPSSLAVGPAGVEDRLYLTGPETDAQGADAPEGFVVFAGSQGRAAHVASIHAYMLDLRNELIATGILADEGSSLRMTQDYVFNSPSTAAGVLLGRTANGRIEWRNEKGLTLKMLQARSVKS